MAYAMDLSPRQTTRTLEQAVRHEARLILRCLARQENESIACRLKASESALSGGLRRAHLVAMPYVTPAFDEFNEPEDLSTPDTALDKYSKLVGTYCDAALYLGESRYLFSTDVIAAENESSPVGEVRLYVHRPEIIQVAQRRRFWRFGLASSSQVQLSWTNPDNSPGVGVGWLCNVSADGVACRVNSRLSDLLGIGEQIQVDFILGPYQPERFCLPATLCNKTPAGTKNTIILGMQFLADAGQDAAAQSIENLRVRLLSLNDALVKAKKGAGR